MRDADFYAELTPLERFELVAGPENYTPVPETWDIFVTDVRGSTKAIEAGRYKDVNLLGASCIVAALNACDRVKIPYVFGGDGATLLVPPALSDDVARALAGVRRMASDAFGLELRVGRVPVKAVLAEGPRVDVAKYRVSETVELAMFTGGGLAHAEDMVKGRDAFEVPVPDPLPEPELDGLHCRWKPIQNSRGTMLSLMVVARASDESDRSRIYREVLSTIDRTVEPGEHSPSRSHLELSSRIEDFDAEARAHTGQVRGLRKTVYQAKVRAKTGVFSALDRRNQTMNDLDPATYKREVVANTDFRKFDDCLRMVIDVSSESADRLRDELEARHRNGEIFFGMHRSDTALMTCLVFNMRHDHVHFVDGNDGGYAMAARELKAQLKTFSPE